MGFIVEIILGMNPLTSSGAIIVKQILRGKIAIWTGDPLDIGIASINGCAAYMISSAICIIIYPIIIYLFETYSTEAAQPEEGNRT